MRANVISGEIVDAAVRVHSSLGPGLLESAYQACLAHDLRTRGLDVAVQVPLGIEYRGIALDVGYRLDLLIENSVVVEIKAVVKLTRLHEAQLLSYLRLGRFRLGLLLNFHVLALKDGLKRLVNGL